YRTIGIGSSVWLAGAQGHVYSEGTQHTSAVVRTANQVPAEGAGTLALTGNMKEMDGDFVRGVSFKGYGVSIALGVGIPIPILDEDILLKTTVRDRDIRAQVIDYSIDYPMKTGKVLATVNYETLKSGIVNILGRDIETASLSSYSMALKIAEILKAQIRDGNFLLNKPYQPLPPNQSMKAMKAGK
ncbi:MAG: homocysteine biosynthesis protein, partial [Spirochaetales bacterium]|nr:homocysteine biosynthesis protein [Spirochaetales bacterium]